MGKTLSQRIAAAALSLMLVAAASGCAGPMRRPGGTGVRPGTRPGGVTQGGILGGTTTPRLGGMTGAGGGGAPGTTGAGAGGTTMARMDLGQEISAFVAGLSVLNGGTAGTTGPAGTTGTTGTTVGTTGVAGTGVTAPGSTSGTAGSTGGMVGATGGTSGAAGTTGAGGGGTAAGTMRPGWTGVGMARRVGVSTLIIGNTAYVGIDPATMSVAWTGNTPGLPAAGTTGVGAGGGGTTTGTTTTGTTGVGTTGTTGTVGTTGTTGTFGTSGVTGAGTLESYIRSRILVQFPQIADVLVTTNPRHVHRIARVHGDMLGGIPATRRMPEIMMIIRDITPAATSGAGGGGTTR